MHAPGFVADVDVIDLASRRLLTSHLELVLPTGGKRLLQVADGCRLAIVSGEIRFDHGEPTGARPGGVGRSGR